MGDGAGSFQAFEFRNDLVYGYDGIVRHPMRLKQCWVKIQRSLVLERMVKLVEYNRMLR